MYTRHGEVEENEIGFTTLSQTIGQFVERACLQNLRILDNDALSAWLVRLEKEGDRRR